MNFRLMFNSSFKISKIRDKMLSHSSHVHWQGLNHLLVKTQAIVEIVYILHACIL